MRFDVELPRKYGSKLLELPPFGDDGKITERVHVALENVLYVYSYIGIDIAQKVENNPQNYWVDDVYIVGSGSKENRIISDIDFLLIAPRIDPKSSKDIKLLLSYVFFNDRQKVDAIDTFIRDKDIYPERSSTKITDQVSGLLKKYNNILVGIEERTLFDDNID